MNLVNTERVAEDFIRENKLQFEAKRRFKEVCTLSRKMYNNVISGIPHDLKKIIEEEIGSNYETGSLQNILVHSSMMTDEQRAVYDDVGTAILNNTFHVELAQNEAIHE